MANWIYLDSEDNPVFQIFKEDMTDGWYGMVYLISNNITTRQYIGKKFFWSKSFRQEKGKKKRVLKQSDWLTYYGSSKEVQEDVKKYGKENFTRVVLKLCKSKAECAYYEIKTQIDREVLFHPDQYYNSFIGCRIHRKHVYKEK